MLHHNIPHPSRNEKKPMRCKTTLDIPETCYKGRAWIELDREALRHNVRVLRALLPQGCTLMPVVKADAYGHGDISVTRELNRMGINAFCVAAASEGARLRAHGITGEILILGYTHPSQLELLPQWQLTQTVVDRDYAELLNAFGRKRNRTLPVHVAVDTGMHRLGERVENFDRIREIFQMSRLRIDGVFTHLCADDTEAPEDIAFTENQSSLFCEMLRELEKQGFSRPKVHILSSSGLLNYPRLTGDYARIGIALYGALRTPVDLHPVLSVKARVASVRCLHQGERAGYGLSYTAQRESRIATLSIGYADGLPRALSEGVGSVLLNGCSAPIAGRICMDQTLVDVSGIPDVCAGDTAVLIGTSGDARITACDIAAQAGTIPNEILSRLGSRLERTL